MSKATMFACATCGQKFAGYGGKRKYCSAHCMAIAYKGKSPHNKDQVERPCLICGKPFTATRQSLQKYCSRTCYHVARKGVPLRPPQHITTVCHTCGKTFDADSPSRKFCSRTCAGRTRIGLPPTNKTVTERQCMVCGATFSTSLSADKKYCSTECYHEARRGVAVTPRKRVKRVCKTCGKEFETWPSLLKNGGANFCSRECHHAHQRTIRGEQHPLKKQYARLTCQWCGETYECIPALASRSRFCSRNCLGAYTVSKRPFSKLERTVAAYFDEIGITYVQQAPVSHYVCDFYLPDYNLLVECDGWRHQFQVQIDKDALRDRKFKELGYRVLHLTDKQIESKHAEYKTILIGALGLSPKP